MKKKKNKKITKPSETRFTLRMKRGLNSKVSRLCRESRLNVSKNQFVNDAINTKIALEELREKIQNSPPESDIKVMYWPLLKGLLNNL